MRQEARTDEEASIFDYVRYGLKEFVGPSRRHRLADLPYRAQFRAHIRSPDRLAGGHLWGQPPSAAVMALLMPWALASRSTEGVEHGSSEGSTARRASPCRPR